MLNVHVSVLERIKKRSSHLDTWLNTLAEKENKQEATFCLFRPPGVFSIPLIIKYDVHFYMLGLLADTFTPNNMLYNSITITCGYSVRDNIKLIGVLVHDFSEAELH